MKRTMLAALCCTLLCMPGHLSTATAKGNTLIFHPQHAKGTYPADINPFGTIVGYWWDHADRTSNFIRTPDGAITMLEILGAAESAATAINRAGVVAGYYKDTAGALSGFVHHTDGTMETFTAHGHDTYATGINDSGTIVGRLVVNSIERGFIRSPHGKITTFDVPGAEYTIPTAINASGTIAGILYGDGDGYALGFVRSADGTYTTFDPPASIHGTDVFGINKGGAIVGRYNDANFYPHGFIRAADGTFTIVDAPGSVHGTHLFAINDHGTTIGYSYGPDGPEGILRTADGTIRPLPSIGTSINNQGLVTGVYGRGGYLHTK